MGTSALKTIQAIGLTLLLLAACGGGTAETPKNTDIPAATPLATVATPVATIDPGSGRFEVSGDMTVAANSARLQYGYSPSVQRHQLRISDTGNTYLLAFTLPDQVQMGAHPLEASGREFTTDGIYTAAFTQAGVAESQMFGKDIAGTLTLDAVGDHLSGSFNFTARNANGQQVSVSGTFTNVPLVNG